MMRKFSLLSLAALLAMPLTAHAEQAVEAADKPGLLDISIGSLVWIIIIFLILVTILYKTAWKNVLAGLKMREERIRKDIGDAEAARLKAEAALRDYTTRLSDAEAKVREILSKGVQDAEQIATSMKMAAQKEAEEHKARAMQEIEAAKNQALREVYTQTAELATSIAEKIIRRNLNADDQRDLVQQSLDQLSGVSAN